MKTFRFLIISVAQSHCRRHTTYRERESRAAAAVVVVRDRRAPREIASVSVTGQLYMYMYDCTAAATTRQAATGSRTSDERQSVSK